MDVCYGVNSGKVSTHSRAEAAADGDLPNQNHHRVSTHSRAEAAANKADNGKQAQRSFNTQPRGGGCKRTGNGAKANGGVSTHSRAEAAADKHI